MKKRDEDKNNRIVAQGRALGFFTAFDAASAEDALGGIADDARSTFV